MKTATGCTSIFKRPQSVLQYTNGHRVYFNIQTATECSTPTAQRQEEGGRTAPDAGRSQTNELSAPSLTEQRAKPTRGGSSLSPVSACYCKFRHRALDRYRHRSKNTGVTRQRAETASTLSQYKLHPRSGDSSVVRAPDSRLKGRGFESPLERRENFLLQGRLSMVTLILVSVPPPCYCSST